MDASSTLSINHILTQSNPTPYVTHSHCAVPIGSGQNSSKFLFWVKLCHWRVLIYFEQLRFSNRKRTQTSSRVSRESEAYKIRSLFRERNCSFPFSSVSVLSLHFYFRSLLPPIEPTKRALQLLQVEFSIIFFNLLVRVSTFSSTEISLAFVFF